jgi:hypothetical protein
MPGFKAPQYTKILNKNTGVNEPLYVFNINFTESDEKLSFITESLNEITVSTISGLLNDNPNWWIMFINDFLQSSIKYFSKPYTIENINKIVRHSIVTGKIKVETPTQIVLTPVSINISVGTFTVNWEYDATPLVIDIPDLNEHDMNKISIHPPVKNGEVEEVDIDDIPTNKDSTEADFQISSPAKFYDKQRVKEARLKAKLAVFKAQRQISKYYEKYGDDISDSDTETDYDTSDDDNDNELSDNEEVQL